MTAMRLQRFISIHLLAKQIQSSESSLNKSLHCYKLVMWMQIPRGTLFKACHCLFMSSKKAFRPLLSYDFQVCVTEMAISLIVDIFDLWVKL